MKTLEGEATFANVGKGGYSTNKNAMAHLGNGSRLNRRQRSVSRRSHVMVPLTRDSSWKPQCTDRSNSTVRWFGCARDTNQVARAGPGAQDSAAPRYIPGQLWLPVTPRQASRQLIHPRSRVEQNVLGGCRENSVRGAFQWLLQSWDTVLVEWVIWTNPIRRKGSV